MNNRQNLAEHGTGLCLWGLGIAAGVNPFVAGVVIGTIFWDLYRRCTSARARGAMKKAQAALASHPHISERGITAALAILRDFNFQMRVDRTTLKNAETRGDFPNTLFETVFSKIPVPKDDGVETALRVVIEVAWDELRLEDETHKLFTQESLAWLERATAEMAEKLNDAAAAHVEIKTSLKQSAAADARHEALLQRLLDRIEAAPPLRAERARHEQLVIALATRYAEGTPSDFDSAFRGLEQALRIAAQPMSTGNLDDDTSRTVGQVRKLNFAGQTDKGASVLAEARTAFQVEDERRAATYLTLLDRSIEQAVLTRSVVDCADLLFERISLTHPDKPALEVALADEMIERQTTGASNNLIFDLEVAARLGKMLQARSETHTSQLRGVVGEANARIELARRTGNGQVLNAVSAVLEASRDATSCEAVPDVWGELQNCIGITQLYRGELMRPEGWFRGAVEALSDAAETLDAEAFPEIWARNRVNLGNAHLTYGGGLQDPSALQAAIPLYEDAIRHSSPENSPQLWSTAVNNLGFAHLSLGERSKEKGSFEKALMYFEQALTVRDAETTPIDWSRTQGCIAMANSSLAQITGETIRYKRAVSAYQAALMIHSKETAPQMWAATLTNMATPLLELRKAEQKPERMTEAAAALSAALEVRPRDTMPVPWAFTAFNYACVLFELAAFENTRVNMQLAREYAADAREAFTKGGATAQLVMIDSLEAEMSASGRM